MAQVKVLNLDNTKLLSDLSVDDTKNVSGGAVAAYAATYAVTKSPFLARLASRAAYRWVKGKTGSHWKALAASLSTPA